MTTGVSAEWIGGTELHHRLDGMMSRYRAPEGAYGYVTTLLEENEAAIFRRLHGRYDRTGATRRSLTDAAGADAIRRVFYTQLEFGTDVWYARFLTRRIGPAKGRRGGLKRTGGSAVLRLTAYRRKQIAQKVLDYCVEGEAEMLATTTGGAGE